MIGITLLRVSNPTNAAIQSVPANNQYVFMEGQVQNIGLDYSEFRGPNSTSQAGSVAGSKARIKTASVLLGASLTTYDARGAGAGLVIELGNLDNDGYFTTHLSSNA